MLKKISRNITFFLTLGLFVLLIIGYLELLVSFVGLTSSTHAVDLYDKVSHQLDFVEGEDFFFHGPAAGFSSLLTDGNFLPYSEVQGLDGSVLGMAVSLPNAQEDYFLPVHILNWHNSVLIDGSDGETYTFLYDPLARFGVAVESEERLVFSGIFRSTSAVFLDEDDGDLLLQLPGRYFEQEKGVDVAMGRLVTYQEWVGQRQGDGVVLMPADNAFQSYFSRNIYRYTDISPFGFTNNVDVRFEERGRVFGFVFPDDGGQVAFPVDSELEVITDKGGRVWSVKRNGLSVYLEDGGDILEGRETEWWHWSGYYPDTQFTT